ncbi:hypothetical protein [Mesorhizobium sp. LSHC412B00]|uniref:hypothetical protein n=1 Tax=Mesorhizobium sp. LSHC412B00 TaxID=1287285 RepID=UPI0012ECA909|nr:hypothetical protein [Mesorhizobium sp. LSHC412B00]
MSGVIGEPRNMQNLEILKPTVRSESRPWGDHFLENAESDTYPCDDSSPDSDPRKLGAAETRIRDIDRAVDRVLSDTNASSPHITAISYGAIRAGYYGATHPEKVWSLRRCCASRQQPADAISN